MARLHPGVYIEEVPSGARPIEGVSTSTGGFIGKAEMGPLDEAVLLTKPREFGDKFGGFISDSFLAHAVQQFFVNGGKTCYVVRVAGNGVQAADIAIRDRKANVPAPTLTIRAANEGAWGNGLDVAITDGTEDAGNEFNIEVYLDRGGRGSSTPVLVETHSDLSMDPAADNYVEKVIEEDSDYITVEVDANNLADATIGNAARPLQLGEDNGGTETTGTAAPTPGTSRSAVAPAPDTILPADRRRIVMELNDDGRRDIQIPGAADTGPAIATAIRDAVQNLLANDPNKQPAYDSFACQYDTTNPGSEFYELTSGTSGTDSKVVVTDAIDVVGTSRSAVLPVGNGAGAGVLKLSAAAGATAPGTGTWRSANNPETDPDADQRGFMINLDGDGAQQIMIPVTVSGGQAVAAAIAQAVGDLTPNDVANRLAYEGFTCQHDDTGGAGNEFYLLTSGTSAANPNSSVEVTDLVNPATGLPVQPISLGNGNHTFTLRVNGDGPHVVTLTGPLANGAAIATAIQNQVQAIIPKRNANADAFANFECRYQNTSETGNPSLLLISGTFGVSTTVEVTNGPGPENVAGRLRLGLTNLGTETTGAAVLRPANSLDPTEYHLGDARVSGNVASVTFGADGATPGSQDYINAVTVGQSLFDTVRDVNILAIPGNGDAAVVAAGAGYCALRGDCFFVGDLDDTIDTVEEARDFIRELTEINSYAAVYYPWLKMVDPTGASTIPIIVPPSGAVAGMYARIDATRGVWKAPAGTEAGIRGITGLVTQTTDEQQDFLNPIGVNVIRSFPAAGTVIWGSRTLATTKRPEYRYIPVRRTAIFLEQSIYEGIQWAVFEPNDEPLWASLRLNVNAFMLLQFRAGAFQGSTPNKAFFVKCDDETSIQADIDAGVVNILVGFAPLKPAEFVVLKLTQIVGQAAG
ncbi:MAG: phage tail sheath subtilisin-like domain-containing protein [Phycisphaerae bacterium]|nr:phage tail sheath subtilisin-like domain-containing protein [Phycisphaerae bacterium]